MLRTIESLLKNKIKDQQNEIYRRENGGAWGMFASSVLLDGRLIYLTFDDKSDAELEISTRNLRTQLESIQQVKFAELESRVIVLEAKIRQLDFEINRPTRKPDDSASNVISTNREEYQSWALKNASGRNRQILADHFKKKNEFKVSLKPTQKRSSIQTWIKPTKNARGC